MEVENRVLKIVAFIFAIATIISLFLGAISVGEYYIVISILLVFLAVMQIQINIFVENGEDDE